MLAEIGSLPDVLEGVMMVCFGASWPFAILKTWRTKRCESKSLVFLVMVFLGYASGIAAKWATFGLAYLPGVTALYAINSLMVVADLVLVLHYRRHPPSLPVGQA